MNISTGILVDSDNRPTQPNEYLNVECRQMTVADIDDVVEIHLTAFKGFFLSRMGRGFLRVYYRTVLNFDASIAYIANERAPSHIVGFVVGFHTPQEFYTKLSKQKHKLLPHIALAILRDPRLLIPILHNKTRVTSQSTPSEQTVELSSIAVNGLGKGVGNKLLNAFIQQVQNSGGQRVSLTTDTKGNDAVLAFYEKNQFNLVSYEMRGNRQLCHYIREL